MSNPVPTLEAVTLFEGNGSILVRYELNSPVPQRETFLIGVHGRSQDGQILRQFGIKFLDGKSNGYFVFDHNAAKQDNFDHIAATKNPLEILTPYPASTYYALGDAPQLRGYLNYAGVDQQADVRVEIVS
jgi:hypothetical protein